MSTTIGRGSSAPLDHIDGSSRLLSLSESVKLDRPEAGCKAHWTENRKERRVGGRGRYKNWVLIDSNWWVLVHFGPVLTNEKEGGGNEKKKRAKTINGEGNRYGSFKLFFEGASSISFLISLNSPL